MPFAKACKVIWLISRRACKIHVPQKLLQGGYVGRVLHRRQVKSIVVERSESLNKTFYPGEVCFIKWPVNSKNDRCWTSSNPVLIRQQLLLSKTVNWFTVTLRFPFFLFFFGGGRADVLKCRSSLDRLECNLLQCYMKEFRD